jgi:hypothetical protein
MSKMNWDRVHRENLVYRSGSEPLSDLRTVADVPPRRRVQSRKRRLWKSLIDREKRLLRRIKRPLRTSFTRRRIRCPYCDEPKIGLIDHIRAKHPTKAGKWIRMSNQSQAKPPSKVGKSKCRYCAKFVKDQFAHLLRIHKLKRLECPYCYEEFGAASAGPQKCPSCKRWFTLNRNYRPKGDVVECRHCGDDIYTEKSGIVICPACRNQVRVNKDLTLSKNRLIL